MKLFKRLRLLVFLIFLGLFLPTCDVVDPHYSDAGSLPIGRSTITYIVSGGLGGGIQTKLIINSSGTATLENIYPPLELQLSDTEYDSLLSHFNGFRELPEDLQNHQCADDFMFSIELQGTNYSKRVMIDGCTIYSQKNSNVFVTKINTLTTLLGSLAHRIHDIKASWIGLTADYSIDGEIYGLGEPITIRYLISNPTPDKRAIYFLHNSQFWFRLYRINFPPFIYEYPIRDYSDSSAPSEILLNPGETKEITYVWDQRVHTSDGDTAIGIGSYALNMGLFAGELPMKAIWFEVLDRNDPIGGVIIEDANGSSSISSTYTFALSVHNWTSTSVTLHFPSSQTIGVELYDLVKPTPGPLLYAGPTVTDSLASVVTLAPGEVRTFTHIANKSDFVPWYMWTYARISLRCSNFIFIRDGQLRMFPFH